MNDRQRAKRGASEIRNDRERAKRGASEIR
jgi:hypothetical protein